jgi:hypothetical protein
MERRSEDLLANGTAPARASSAGGDTSRRHSSSQLRNDTNLRMRRRAAAAEQRAPRRRAPRPLRLVPALELQEMPDVSAPTVRRQTRRVVRPSKAEPTRLEVWSTAPARDLLVRNREPFTTRTRRAHAGRVARSSAGEHLDHLLAEVRASRYYKEAEDYLSTTQRTPQPAISDGQQTSQRSSVATSTKPKRPTADLAWCESGAFPPLIFPYEKPWFAKT